jgi:hypothetical protein
MIVSLVLGIREGRSSDQVAGVGTLEPRDETFANGGVDGAIRGCWLVRKTGEIPPGMQNSPLRRRTVLLCIRSFEPTGKQMRGKTKAIASSCATLPVVTVQTVDSAPGVGARISR